MFRDYGTTKDMTPDELFPPIYINPDVVMLITYGFYPRRCYPCLWYGLRTRWQVYKYCLNSSSPIRSLPNKWDLPMRVTLWLENKVGNDELLGEWVNGQVIYLKDENTIQHYKTLKGYKL
jgi:hypothetical protein